MDLQKIKEALGERYEIKASAGDWHTLSDSDVVGLVDLVSELLHDGSESIRDFSPVEQAANNRASLHELVNLAASFLNRSLIVIDLSFRVLEHSTSVPVTDPLWLHNIANGYCSHKFMSAMNNLLPGNTVVQDNRAFLVNCDSSTENKLCCRLEFRNNVIGYAALIDNNNGILPYHIEYLPKICGLIVTTLSREPRYQYMFNSTGNNIYSGLLLHPEDKDKLLQEYRDLGHEAVPCRCIEMRASNHSLFDLTYLQRLAEGIFPSGIFFIYREILVGVIPEGEMHCLPDESSSLFENIREVGISSTFEDPAEFPLQFENAQKACRLAARTRNGEKISCYDTCAFFDLIDHVSDSGVLAYYIHPLLKVLHEYDLTHDTNLFDTLDQYLQNERNIKLTAEKIYVHRNTLNYRLSKIHELAGVEHWSHEEIFRLECSFRINKLLHIT